MLSLTQDQLTDIAQGIATALSESPSVADWTVEPLTDARMTYPSRHLTCTTGYSFYIHDDGKTNGKARLSVRGNWPKTADGREQWPSDYDGGRPGITVSADKSPAKIARDIVNRFLPAYVAVWAKMKERADYNDDHAAKTKANAARLLADDPTLKTAHNQSSDGSEVAIYFGGNSHGYQMRVSGDSVRFEHFSCPIEIARKLIVDLRKVQD